MDMSPTAAQNHAFEQLLERLKTPVSRPLPTDSLLSFAARNIESGTRSGEKARRQAIERLYERIANRLADVERK